MSEPDIYIRGQIALDSGDLLDVVNVKVDHTNGGKLVHTIRKTPSGVTLGTKEATVSYDTVVGQNGAERDYATMVKKGTVKRLRIKVPGETITITGIYTTRSFDLPLDDAIKLSLSFIGIMTD